MKTRRIELSLSAMLAALALTQCAYEADVGTIVGAADPATAGTDGQPPTVVDAAGSTNLADAASAPPANEQISASGTISGGGLPTCLDLAHESKLIRPRCTSPAPASCVLEFLSCGAYRCRTPHGGCRSSCDDDLHCASGHRCATGRCLR